jgi:hypothetical protein
MQKNSAIYEELKRSIRERYSSIPQNDGEMVVDALRMFNDELLGTRDVNRILQEAGELIFSLFGFKEVLIGLQEGNGLFKYSVILGHSKRAEEAIVEAEYRIEEMACCEDYPCITVSHQSEFCFKEDLPDDEREVRQFNRPSEISVERTNLEDMMEGDYLDVFIYGPEDKMLGWIEVSYPTNGKFPSRETIRGLELLASNIGVAINYIGMPK